LSAVEASQGSSPAAFNLDVAWRADPHDVELILIAPVVVAVE
jgi:hypothetical protein